jgi:hypothetical protein
VSRRLSPGACAALLAAAVVTAAASLLLGHTMRYDPQGWLLWGREIGQGLGPFDTSAYPSWKPLALVLALPFAATGAAAPTLWLLMVRTVGILALLMVGRMAAQRAGALGGAVAVALLALAPAWWPTMLGGGIEPVIVALACAAVFTHERGRHGLALTMLAAMALGREEALLLVLAYGASVWRARPALPLVATMLCATVAAAWFLGDWLGSGDPGHGATLARAAAPETPLSRFDSTETLIALVVVPIAVALAAAGLAAARRTGDRVVLAIAVAGVAWVGADLVLLGLGYPVPARFVLPAAAAWALTAGVGVRPLPSAALRRASDVARL